MSPTSTVRCFVTQDARRTDSNLGPLPSAYRHRHVTPQQRAHTGSIYQAVINKNAAVITHGGTVQVIPPHHPRDPASASTGGRDSGLTW